MHRGGCLELYGGVVLLGFIPYLQDQLVSFSALTLLVLSYMTCKSRPQYDL